MKLGVFWKFIAMKKTITDSKGNGGFLLFAASSLLFLALLSGCGNKFFDPTQVGRFRPVPAVNVILDSLGVAEETPVAWEGAEEPLPIDTVVRESDYVFRAGDIVSIIIFELLQEGVQYANNYVVTETGKVSIPEVGVVQAAGLTETQLEEEIRKILAPNILKEPSVTATLIRSQQRAFSILGDGVPLPGRYFIPRYDFRLTDALATAGGPRQFNVSYIYVSRFVGDRDRSPESVNPGYGELELKVIQPETTRPEMRRRKMAAPRAQYQWPKSKVVIASSEMITDRESAQLRNRFGQFNNRLSSGIYARDTGTLSDRIATRETADEPASVEDILKTLSERSRREEMTNKRAGAQDTFRSSRQPVNREERIDERVNLRDALRSSVAPTGSRVTNESVDQDRTGNIEWVFQDGKWVPVQVEPTKPPEEERAGHIEWIFQDGKWVPVQVGPPRPIKPVIKIEPGEQLAAPPREKEPVFALEQEGARTRLIRIPADKLLAGDPRYNIVIKPGDSIFVPVDIVGEFCIMGNVNRTGYIPITGRPMTLKQAIAAAGGLGPLAWPKRCEVVRRIGRKKEEIVMVDLDKIASGEQPDFFIKPHDLINVGTHATARWR
jgi:protein involved in polysaccharide export with SLBB domain